MVEKYKKYNSKFSIVERLEKLEKQEICIGCRKKKILYSGRLCKKCWLKEQPHLF